MLKKLLGIILSTTMLLSSTVFPVPTFAEDSQKETQIELSDYEKKIASFNPEYVMWTDTPIQEGFSELSPNQDNKTSSGVQTPYGNANEYLTNWAYYEFLWTHGYPVGNGRLAATVMGGIDKEVIQINEDTVWTGSPYISNGEPTSGSVKDAWQFYRGSNPDGTPAAIGSGDAIVGNSDFRAQFPNFSNKSIAYQALNVVNEQNLEAVQGRYNLIAMVEKYFLGSPNRQKAYQSFVETYLDFGQNNSGVSNYTKSLNMQNASVTVDYDYNGAHYTRETIASYPSQTVATNIKVQNGELDFNAELHSFLENIVFEKVSDNQIRLTAKVKDGKTNEVGGASAIKTEARMLIEAPNSNITVSDDASNITIKGGNEATVYVVGATNYVDYLTLDDNKPKEDCDKYIEKIQTKNYSQIKTAHEEDYKKLFSRSNLSISNFGFDSEGIPTEKRIRKDVGDKSGFEIGAGNKLDAANKNGVYSTLNDGDNKIAVLQFNYGKYLMIAGSRDADESKGIPMSQPLNLTGKWNPSLNPSWSGKYTININTEMNYWLAQPLGLAECEKPLLNVYADLAKSGSITAREQYGIKNARGDNSYKEGDPWVMHHNFDLWRGTQPIDNATAGVWPTGGVWLLDHAWQYYVYNKDEEYLAEFYPLMKGAADFFTQFLVLDQQTGYLVTAASVSPEQGSIQPGPAMDTQLIRNLYQSTIEAAEILGKSEEDATLISKIKEQLPQNNYLSDEKGKIAPNLIDKTGLIQEWARGDVGFDFSTGDTWTVTNPFTSATTGYKYHTASNSSEHRHCSHLWELYPGTHLNAYSDDENENKIFEAYKKSVAARGAGSGQGWGIAWRIALSARALDGETALSRIEQLLRTRTSPNLLGQHPNFQIDCNYGMTAGIIEMLLQSHTDTIDILPALPTKWNAGKFEGFKARNNVDVSASWKKGIPTKVVINSADGGEIKIRNPYVGTAVIKDTDGNEIKSTLKENNTVIAFIAEEGKDYKITGFGEIEQEEGVMEVEWQKLANTTTDFFGTYSESKGSIVKPKQENSGTNVGYIWDERNGEPVGFAYPDCELEGLTKLLLNVNGKVNGTIKISVRKGSKDGEEIAVGYASKSDYAYVEMPVTTETPLTGTSKLFVVFTGDTNTSAYNPGYMANVKDLKGIREVAFINSNPVSVYKADSKYNKNSMTEGEYSIKVDFEKLNTSNNSDNIEKAYIIIAFYNDKNVLVSMVKKEATKNSNEIKLNISKEQANGTVKIMTWNNLEEMTPLSKIKEFL